MRLFRRTPRRKPGRPPASEYRRVCARHHKVQCVARGCKENRIWKLDVHHKDGNPWNNKPRNLEWRCEQHHHEVHGRWWPSPRSNVVRLQVPVAATGAYVAYHEAGQAPNQGKGCCLGLMLSLVLWSVLGVGVLVLMGWVLGA